MYILSVRNSLAILTILPALDPILTPLIVFVNILKLLEIEFGVPLLLIFELSSHVMSRIIVAVEKTSSQK